jgi:hypothetical protein
MKDDVNDEVPNGTFKSLIPFDGVLKHVIGKKVTMSHIFLIR